MINHYIEFGILLAAVCLLASGMFIWSRVHYTIKIALGIVLTLVTIGAWSVAGAMLGYPVRGFPPKGAILISVDYAKDEKLIYLWVRVADGRRVYAVPYGEKMRETIKRSQDFANTVGGIIQIDAPDADVGVTLNVLPSLPGKRSD